jgi:signal transduction histidine kinase
MDMLRPADRPLFEYLSKKTNFNLFLPIKRSDELFAVLALSMQHVQRTINREDIQTLLQLANQTAIAFENNNYIKESARLVQELTETRVRKQYVQMLEESNRQLDQKNKELNRLFKELQQKEGQLIHSGKMASLGQLVAGISHELNNPISFIYANTKALESYLSELETLWSSLPIDKKDALHTRFLQIVSDLKEIVSDNLNGSKSVKELVLNLKNFSRIDQADWKETRLRSGIESSLHILKPQLNDSIRVVKEYVDDLPVYCNPGQLNQVFLNILSNAIQALNGSGTITITLKTRGKYLTVAIADTGSGIPKEILPKIFDPFFTTKEVNQGSGLGLSISYSIIRNHRGNLSVTSRPGEGSVFTIELPLTKEGA